MPICLPKTKQTVDPRNCLPSRDPNPFFLGPSARHIVQIHAAQPNGADTRKKILLFKKIRLFIKGFNHGHHRWPFGKIDGPGKWDTSLFFYQTLLRRDTYDWHPLVCSMTCCLSMPRQKPHPFLHANSAKLPCNAKAGLELQIKPYDGQGAMDNT